jgi:hypothetical protein
MTAYMLSVTFLKMESPVSASDYATKAINSEPKLEEPYSTGVREITDWASKVTFIIGSGEKQMTRVKNQHLQNTGLPSRWFPKIAH